MLTTKVMHAILFAIAMMTFCKTHTVDASIIFKRFADNAPESQIVLLEPITVLGNPFARRSSQDKKDESGGSNPGGSNHGPKLPPQPPRRQLEIVRPQDVEKAFSNEVWQSAGRHLQDKVKEHLQKKEGGSSSQ